MGRPPQIVEPRKQSLYLHAELLRRVMDLADERQRSFSFLVQQALQYWLDHDAPDVRIEGRRTTVTK